MKKLLSLLSVLTISGTAIPTTIAANPYKKQLQTNKIIKGSESDYQQINNLERLNRIKKAVPFLLPSEKTAKINEELIVDRDNPADFFSSLQRIIRELSNINILEFRVSLNKNGAEDNSFYRLNAEEYSYFRIPVVFRNVNNNIQNQQNLELVFRTDNLYLQGFIVNVEPQGGHTGPIYNYYHFDFTLERYQPYNHPHLIKIDGTNSHNLEFGGAYRDLRVGVGSNRDISWNHIYNSFLWINNTNNYQLDEPNYVSTRTSLGQIILVTAEAIRSIELYNILRNDFINNRAIVWEPNARNNNIHIILMNWGRDSRSLEQSLNQFTTTNNNISIDNDNIRNAEIQEINTLWENLNSQGIRVALESIALLNWHINLNCNRKQRDLNNDLNQKFCNLKPEINKIQGKINIIRILESDSSENPWVKKGYVILGTKNGVYTIHQNGSVNKRMGDFNEEVTNIIINKDYNSAFIFTKDNLYVLKFKEKDGENWNSFKINLQFNLNNIAKVEILNENTEVFNLKLILKYNQKINGIDENINEIQSFHDENSNFLLVKTITGKVYYVEGNRVLKYDIDLPVNSIYRFNKDSSGDFKSGDVVFGTINGLYLAPKFSLKANLIKK